MSNPLLEIACFTPSDAIAAWQAGAQRIELCADHSVGGTTPRYEDAVAVRDAIGTDMPLHVMIRPRGGDFEYSDAEFEAMKFDILRFKSIVDGFVMGVLTAEAKEGVAEAHADAEADGSSSAFRIDIARTAELVRLADPLPCTFHRAIDHASDPSLALGDVVRTGCAAILTSGGAPDALSGATTIAAMVRKAGSRVVVIPGGGVRASNIHELRRLTGASVFHSSAMPSGGLTPQASEIQEMKRLLLTD